MATSTVSYKALIMPSQRRTDGSYNIKIRITFKRKSRYIATNLYAGPRDVTSKKELKGGALISANRIIDQFHTYIAELNFFALQEMDVDDVLRYVTRKASNKGAFKLDFFVFAEQFIKTKLPGTQGNYRTAINAFRRFLGKDHIDINEITYSLLLSFGQFLDSEPKQCGGVGQLSNKPKKKGAARAIYTTKIKSIYEEAKKIYNDDDNGVINIPRNPFARLELKLAPSLTHTAKSPEFIQKIISFKGPCSGAQRLALDIYIISFALMGMNAVDLMQAPPAKKGVIIYNRAKTRDRRPDRAEHRVKIDPRIKPLLDKYKDPYGEHLTNFYLYYKDNVALDSSLRSLLRSWAQANDEIPFTLYSARHSWATIARSAKVGVDKSIVNECLAHIDPGLQIADVYIEKDWQVLWDANEKVLDLFDWSNIDNIAKIPILP